MKKALLLLIALTAFTVEAKETSLVKLVEQAFAELAKSEKVGLRNDEEIYKWQERLRDARLITATSKKQKIHAWREWEAFLQTILKRQESRYKVGLVSDLDMLDIKDKIEFAKAKQKQ